MPSWHEVDRCVHSGIQFKLNWNNRMSSTSGQLVRKSPGFNFRPTWAEVTARFESRVTCGQLDHKFRIWLLPNLGRSYCAEPIAGYTCAQFDHKWGFIGLTSGHDGQKFFLKIVSKSDTFFLPLDQVGPKLRSKTNLWPSWSQVEKAGSKSVAKLTILFTSSHHGTKCVRMLYATITSSQLGTKFAPRIICNRNFVASCNKVSDLLFPTWA